MYCKKTNDAVDYVVDEVDDNRILEGIVEYYE